MENGATELERVCLVKIFVDMTKKAALVAVLSKESV